MDRLKRERRSVGAPPKFAVNRRSRHQPGIERVWAYVDEENYASARVLEKSGMQREGILRSWSLHPNLGTRPRDCWSFSVAR